MNEQDALFIVYENILGMNSLSNKLSDRLGLDEEQFQETVRALELLIDHYKNELAVPKKLALCMVDIYGAFDFDRSYYTDKSDREKIEDAGIKLQQLAMELFS
ncbi:hypothetical protein [Parafilimonas terrae]|uniref:Uncharacterized protein n=1 Tax=Parafilimonas terrae TaxID=1465490 RepID=A0A1I5RRF6_9BACT|nr:hypothetical protein [Parafilimonas terrae]SFP61095.1 hypothetical protein SAMN05444277_101380 [Parafilimonas terrae]